MKRRILYVITLSEFGGAQSHVLDLVRGFSAEHEVHLATSTEGPLTVAARECGATVHLLPHLVRNVDPAQDARCVRETVALMRRVRPNLVHLHSSKAGIVGRAAARIAGVPAVFTAHGWGFSPGTPRARGALAWAFEKAAAPLARAIICVSEHDRRLALRCRVGRRARLYTVRLGIADTDFPLADAAVEPARLVMVARFNEQKDQATLLRAWAQLASSGELGEATLDFIGSGPSLEACTELSQVLGVGGSVSFLGDRADVPEMLSRAQAFVLATHYEGLPVSILEAMRAGLPVVASDVGGVREEVAHGKTGLLVRRGDVGALADALRQIIRSPDERASLGRAGRDKYLQEFSTARMLAQTGAIYERVLTGRRGL